MKTFCIGDAEYSYQITDTCSYYLVPSQQLCVVRWASKKAGGSSQNGRKSAGKRLGLKCGDGEQLLLLQNADGPLS